MAKKKTGQSETVKTRINPNRRRGKAWGPEDIEETLDQLKDALIKHGDEPTGLVALRLRLLLLIKSEAVKSAYDAQKKIGFSYVTISKWLQTYLEEGLAGLITVNIGGRDAVPDEVVNKIREWIAQGISVDSILDELQVKHGLVLSKWTVYKLANPSNDGELWQCKTTTALDEALAKFARSRKGKKYGNPGGWYRDAANDVVRYNSDLIDAVLRAGAEASVAGKYGDVEPRKAWGVHGSKGSHLGIWLTEDFLALIKKAAKPRENKNQTIRRLLEMGLIESGFSPESEESWAERNRPITPEKDKKEPKS